MQSTINHVMTRSTSQLSGSPIQADGKNTVEKINKAPVGKGTTAPGQYQGTLSDAVWEYDPKLVTQLLEQIQTLTKSVSDLQARAGISSPAGPSESAGTQAATSAMPPPTFASRFPPVASSVAASGASASAAMPPPTFANRFPAAASPALPGASAASAPSALSPPTFANRFQSVAPAEPSATTAVTSAEDKPVVAGSDSNKAVLAAGVADTDKASEASIRADLKSIAADGSQAAPAVDTGSTHELNSLDNLSILDEAEHDSAVVSALETAEAGSEAAVMLLPDGYVMLSKEYVDVFDVAFVTRWAHRMETDAEALA